MVILRNIIAVLAISVCLAAACQKEEEVVVEEIVSTPFADNWVESEPIYIVSDSAEPDGAEEHINRIAESRTVELYIDPENEEDSYAAFRIVVEGIPDTIHCTGGWAGSFRSYKEGGLDITIYCKEHIPVRVSLERDMEEVDFVYSEDAAYESLNVSYHW